MGLKRLMRRKRGARCHPTDEEKNPLSSGFTEWGKQGEGKNKRK